MNLNSLKGKRILVIGATSGIGEKTAYMLAEQGCHLILVGRNKKKLQELKKNLDEDTVTIEYDLHDLDNIEHIFLTSKDNSIKLDGMIYSAGIAKNSIVRANDWRDLEEVLQINCMAFVEVAKYFAMKKYCNDGASIVAISSIASLLNDAGMVQYSASKSALNSAVKTMAKEFVKRKIRVNGILPANVNTDMFLSGKEYIENFMETALERQPLGIIEMEQVGYLSEFLISDCSKYITGELITMGGGMSY